MLAFDCAGRGCSAAVLLDNRVAARRFALMEHGQAAALLPMIEAVLAEADQAVAALDVIGVTVGPGAFTGLRIGLAAARGLALASAVPVIGITTFAAVAAGVPDAMRSAGTLVTAVDSRRAEIYLQCFTPAGEPASDAALLPPAQIADWVPAGPLALAGDAAPRAAAALAGRAVTLVPGAGVPDAADVARLAAARWRPGAAPAMPRPLYLRAPDTSMPRRAAGKA